MRVEWKSPILERTPSRLKEAWSSSDQHKMEGKRGDDEFYTAVGQGSTERLSNRALIQISTTVIVPQASAVFYPVLRSGK